MVRGENTDPFIRFSHFEAHRLEIQDKVDGVKQQVIEMQLTWREFLGSLKFFKWLIGGLTLAVLGGIATEITLHVVKGHLQ